MIPIFLYNFGIVWRIKNGKIYKKVNINIFLGIQDNSYSYIKHVTTVVLYSAI